MTNSAEILTEKHGGIGVITLNRPEALNALTLNMIRGMQQALDGYIADNSVRAIVVKGAGGRAFCSGGDVKAVALAVKDAHLGKGDGGLSRTFFREEYTLNHRIYTCPKPYISLIDGIVMGGGKGISAHGSHRIVTENTLFAMPETSIGFFPDVGGGYFLPRCPGETGLYLALTSKRIRATDTLYIGFATHAMPSVRIADFENALANYSWHDRSSDKDQIDDILSGMTEEMEDDSEIASQREAIDRCFAFDRMEDIIAALNRENDDFENETLKAIYGMSPGSLKIALRQIRLGRTMQFADVMKMEYRLSQACVRRSDFYEGIRAALIDKDRAPKWHPARIEDVVDADIEACFETRTGDELIL